MLGKLRIKQFILLLLCVIGLVSCKFERILPQNYEQIEKNFIQGNYTEVVNLLNDDAISHKEKTDWYYFFYGASLYEFSQSNSKDALRYLKIANSYNNKDYNISFYLGKVYWDIKNYKKAAFYFEKCLTKELKNAKHRTDEAIIWLLLSELKLDTFNYDKFVQKNNCTEIELIKRFLSRLQSGNLESDDILYFIHDTSLTEREKLLLIDELINTLEDKEKLIEELYNQNIPELYKEYFGSRLLYYKLNDKRDCDNLIKQLNSSGDDSFVILNSSEYLVWEYFEKYCAFYYWLCEDYRRTNLSTQNYYNIKLRNSSFTIKYSYDLKLFFKEFKKDREFKEIQKYKESYLN